MRVALISTAWKKIPPNGYGGTESVVANILAGANELNLDIDFNLFTVGQTSTTPQIQSLRGRVKTGWFFETERYSEIGNESTKIWIEALHAMAAWNMVIENPDIELIHDHSGVAFPTIISSTNARPPTLITLHGQLDLPLIRDFYLEIARRQGIYFNSISNAQRRGMPELPYLTTVYNGIRLKEFPFNPNKENYFLILGRITPVKGQKEAIEVARALNMPLVVAGLIEDSPEAKSYWQTQIEPQIEGNLSKSSRKLEELMSLLKTANPPRVIYFGEADSENKKPLYAKARAFLMPISWEEPFGLVMTEAMACGTPVVAFKRGAAPEIIEHGITGFLVDDVGEMISALKQVHLISTDLCRQRVENYFSHTKMAEDYAKLYNEIISLNVKAFC